MKKLLINLVAVIITVSVLAQAPQLMSYQAVIRNNNDSLVKNHNVGMRVSILQGSTTGTVVYEEIYNPNPQTNANGLVSIELGGGISINGTFSSINWANGPYFIKTETDPTGGANYSISGTNQLLSVPYALSALSSSSLSLTGTTGQTIMNNGTTWAASSNLYNDGTNVGIGTTNPSPSAILDLSSTTQGALVPRMTTAQMNAISTPANGLLIVNTDCNNFYYNAGTSSSPNWVAINSSNTVGTPGTITGSASVCANQAGVTYSVAAVSGATSYIWTLPAGATITAGALTSSITVTFGSASGNVSVTANNACGMSSESTLAVTVAWTCGCPLTVTHTAGTIAPVTRTVTYGTVSTTLTGAPECWITQNLGAINQASSATDTTDAAAGWYWEWDTQQGYDYNTSLTPSTFANTYGTDDSWVPANDPCNLLLGAGWRIPTYTEWNIANSNGGYSSGYNTTGLFWTVLQLHAAGYLLYSNESLYNRGSYGFYWSSTQGNAADGWYLFFYSSSSFMYSYSKANGLLVRCLRD